MKAESNKDKFENNLYIKRINTNLTHIVKKTSMSFSIVNLNKNIIGNE